MWVHPFFFGDDDSELMWLQHDLWFGRQFIELDGRAVSSCVYIFLVARNAFLSGPLGGRGGSPPLFDREAVLKIDSFDHRVLQRAHSIIAAFYRWIIAGEGAAAFYVSESYRKAYKLASWKNYLMFEIGSLSFGNPEFAASVVTSVLHQNVEKGYEAEDAMIPLLKKRYGQAFGEDCEAYTARFETSVRPPADRSD